MLRSAIHTRTHAFVQMQTYWDALDTFRTNHGVAVTVGDVTTRQILPSQVYNLDETCLPTTIKVSNVVAVKGQSKAVGRTFLMLCGPASLVAKYTAQMAWYKNVLYRRQRK